ncbi:MAG: glycogen debranching enzyme family protein [Candidatus Tectomicrobia bacterium]|uniref:Glycogen debranching enzyme family protein n=1 Tax=Tectimicrobiota bacterium TaxID=2528274 RepID=A0A932LZT6_UNCTE|nr:glycogen debranching enzyme family protein [Candidatus Tectomicrobia bacterium]
MIINWGREICGNLAAAESREWLCTNGLGGYASGTVAGTLTRRYHGLLVAALQPPLGRTLLVAKLDETMEHDGLRRPLFTNRWADGTVDPHGYRQIQEFRLEGTTPVWTYAGADALLEKRVWMEPGANTTNVRYYLLRAAAPVSLELKALLNYRDYHASTRGLDWQMDVEAIPNGLRVVAFAGAQPVRILAPHAEAVPVHIWYEGFELLRERERGLDHLDDHLHAGTFRFTLRPGKALTVILTIAEAPLVDEKAVWVRRQRHEARLLQSWRKSRPSARKAPAWIKHLVLAADQFVVRRPFPDDPEGMSVIAGYHWFGDWGRDTMISLPGLALCTGRPEVARRILTTFARFVDQGMLPNRFPDSGEEPEYNTVDAALWYFEAIRSYHAATRDNAFLARLFPLLEEIIQRYREGTRYGIIEDPSDGLLRSGQPGIQLTWMDAKVGDWIVTTRMGKPVEINALWYNALSTMTIFARKLKQPADRWEPMAGRVRAGFERFWNEKSGCCYDVLDGPSGHDDSLRPNQILAVSLPASPLSPERQKQVVDICARHLLTSHGLRSLAPGHPHYRGHYKGGPWERDGAYHEGTVWGWLLGPFALAHYRVYGDPATALAFLTPMAHHLNDYGVGSLAEIFDGDPPFTPRGCIAQAWTVAEILRAWYLITAGSPSFG